MSEITVRKAKKGDLKAIYGLVKELAIYEKEPEAVTATLKDYQNDFSEGIFEANVALDGEKVIGTTIYYMSYSTWKGKMLYLEDFVVKEAYRKKGVGQLLFDAYLAVAKEKKAVMVKWQVLDWNEPALNFYVKNNAIIEKNWWSGKIFLEK
jgi:GNAT superfamily N-acetyltransferase